MDRQARPVPLASSLDTYGDSQCTQGGERASQVSSMALDCRGRNLIPVLAVRLNGFFAVFQVLT